MTTIEEIKQQLQRIIELDAVATDGPWEWGDTQDDDDESYPYIPECSYLGDTLVCMAGSYENSREDGALLAASRTIAPAAARALLAAIEVLWDISMEGDYADSRVAELVIKEIQSKWTKQQK